MLRILGLPAAAPLRGEKMSRFGPHYEAQEIIKVYFADTWSDKDVWCPDVDDAEDENLEVAIQPENESSESSATTTAADGAVTKNFQADAEAADIAGTMKIILETTRTAVMTSMRYIHPCLHHSQTGHVHNDSQWTVRNDPNTPPELTATPGLVEQPPDSADVEYFMRLFLFSRQFV